MSIHLSIHRSGSRSSPQSQKTCVHAVLYRACKCVHVHMCARVGVYVHPCTRAGTLVHVYVCAYVHWVHAYVRAHQGPTIMALAIIISM